MRVGVMGVGVVGSAVADSIEAQGHRVLRKDPGKGFDDDLLGCEVIFICVWDDGAMRNLENAFEECAGFNCHIVIKTTAMPGTTDRLAEKFGTRKIAYCPEFLCEETAHEDFARQGNVVIGTRNAETVYILMKLLRPFCGNFTVLSPMEAEILKLSVNSFYALKVTFANEVADLCDMYGARYEPVRDSMYADRFIAPNHLDIHHKGYRGYGGRCLPKDVDMFCRARRSRLMETAREINGERCRSA